MKDSYKHKGLRNALVQSLKARGIKDASVLEAMSKIPRHYFMDSAFIEHAYQDKPFSIGEGQTISQPYTVAFQTELLAIEPRDRVLEIGTGSGYQASILAEMGAEVTSLETIAPLHEKAKEILQLLGYRVRCLLKDGTLGHQAGAPYHKIIVTAGAPVVPTPLIEQLHTGGFLVIPVGDENTQEMLRFQKLEDKKVKKESFGNFSFVKLIGDKGW